ncbi:MAG: hypothetical protein UT55_C0076G0003 [Candidatus Peregrinibacteria bacterium GW2011_GWE2_39_6]|nr:MAG: hypothetical protein UT36_C0007G0036 [Candidatus Peregrinibacteria bacterium GW2011_GWF2_39_17]KKR24047.1 MAG: hypothetical protein UT55_C0076G0003 [Candidatus Peregrinibacteria bacterium GW2011_GWE2_39_6]HCW31897.1 hypothetical protein [Candidatus Peregrinibacteria bacterium]
MKKIFVSLFLTAFFFPGGVLAQDTLLPRGDEALDCTVIMNQSPDVIMSKIKALESRDDYLACAVKTGKLHLWMLPYFITYIANFFIGIAGTVSVLSVMLGGFWYMSGGLTDDKEKGKKTITYALIGLVITLLAWILVNVIQVQLTS